MSTAQLLVTFQSLDTQTALDGLSIGLSTKIESHDVLLVA